MNLEGAIVIVTGGAGGIGEALVRALVGEKVAGIVVSDRDAVGVASVVEMHKSSNVQVVSRTCDVSSQTAVEDLIAFTEEKFGRVDLVCSNAGIMIDGGLELTADDWARSWSINVMAHVHAARAALPGMLARGSGYFLNVSSAAGILTAPGAAPYTATKHAANGFAEWLAIAYGDRGIGVSVVCPEAVETNMLRGSMASGNEGVKRLAAAGTVLGADAVAAAAIAGIKADKFLVTTHPDTLMQTQRKWSDIDRWLKGIRRFLRVT